MAKMWQENVFESSSSRVNVLTEEPANVHRARR
jgi:hypothetical protein